MSASAVAKGTFVTLLTASTLEQLCCTTAQNRTVRVSTFPPGEEGLLCASTGIAVSQRSSKPIYSIAWAHCTCAVQTRLCGFYF